jgi:hypothetical protein
VTKTLTSGHDIPAAVAITPEFRTFKRGHSQLKEAANRGGLLIAMQVGCRVFCTILVNGGRHRRSSNPGAGHY